MFRKILIANRGEIARRVIKTCQKMGIKTVAIYSSADEGNPYLADADEAYLIGPAPVRESYLQGSKIIELAQKTKADAIHPGYGFLSEDHVFAKTCRDAGLSFIGPNIDSMQAMGKKIQSREVMSAAGIPVVRGSKGVLKDAGQALEIARELGYPVLLKASGGGGGIGMVVVNSPENMEKSIEMCQSRAKAYFGDEVIYIEKCLSSPRHIEIQVVADQHGNIWQLGERDCSVQRRHQKVIEESPSPVVTEKMRKAMGDLAVKASAAIGYDSVGTVEMLLDEYGEFYFLEMNTRIQVEHGVTELRTGVDLIAMQILSAAGEHLVPLESEPMGHSMECRIYAENPVTFFPTPGNIKELFLPQGDGIRIDHSIKSDFKVSPYYDPLLAKVMAWDLDRERCIKKMRDIIQSIRILGIQTNIPFLLAVLDNAEFKQNGATTSLVDKILIQMKEAI